LFVLVGILLYLFYFKNILSYKFCLLGFIISNAMISVGLIDYEDRLYLLIVGVLFGVLGFIFYIKDQDFN
jgi:hypothetical protein